MNYRSAFFLIMKKMCINGISVRLKFHLTPKYLASFRELLQLQNVGKLFSYKEFSNNDKTDNR